MSGSLLATLRSLTGAEAVSPLRRCVVPIGRIATNRQPICKLPLVGARRAVMRVAALGFTDVRTYLEDRLTEREWLQVEVAVEQVQWTTDRPGRLRR